MNPVERFISLSGYPDAPAAASNGAVALRIGGTRVEFKAMENGARLSLTAAMPPLPPEAGEAQARLLELLRLALPRSLKEDAVLCYDPDARALLLWQEFAVPGEDAEFLRLVNGFLNAREWWAARISAPSEAAPASGSSPQLMFFRP